MNATEFVREAVARTYSRVKAPAAATRLAGYTAEQLARVPDGVSFFGCGNPLAYAQVQPGQTVLDLGSGAGLDLILAAQAVGEQGRVIGVDMTDAMLALARKNVERAGLHNVELRKGLIEQLPVEDSSVDWVISNCVISLSPEKERVFAEVARVLRPGGRMSISDIVVDAGLAWTLGNLSRVLPSSAMARTEPTYSSAMRAAGLDQIEIVDRYVYETTDLIGLFGSGAADEVASTCPVTVWAERIRSAPIVKRTLDLMARAATGHVWSSKFRASKPSM